MQGVHTNQKEAISMQEKKRKKKTEPVTITPPTKKLTALELALAKREHAEALANMQADEENKALFSKMLLQIIAKHIQVKIKFKTESKLKIKERWNWQS